MVPMLSKGDPNVCQLHSCRQVRILLYPNFGVVERFEKEPSRMVHEDINSSEILSFLTILEVKLVL